MKKTRSLIALVTVIQLGLLLFAGSAYAGPGKGKKCSTPPAPPPMALPGFHRGG